MEIQWYPGHMAKTKRKIQEELKLIDVVIELLDARIPISSKNPEVDSIIQNKRKIILLNKSDLSDPEVNKLWADYYIENKQDFIFTNSITSLIISSLYSSIFLCKSIMFPPI